jgi:hypothetical protein
MDTNIESAIKKNSGDNPSFDADLKAVVSG